MVMKMAVGCGRHMSELNIIAFVSRFIYGIVLFVSTLSKNTLVYDNQLNTKVRKMRRGRRALSLPVRFSATFSMNVSSCATSLLPLALAA